MGVACGSLAIAASALARRLPPPAGVARPANAPVQVAGDSGAVTFCASPTTCYRKRIAKVADGRGKLALVCP